MQSATITDSIHSICGRIGDSILKESARLKTLDNISVVVMAFEKAQEYLNNKFDNSSIL